MKSKAIYPGTFDPVTYGHVDLIKRAVKIFDTVIIAVAHNTHKNPLFTVQERVSMLREATKGIRGVKAYVALVRSNTSGFDEPIVFSPSEELVKGELRAFCEFNTDNPEWNLDEARVEAVWFKEKVGAK